MINMLKKVIAIIVIFTGIGHLASSQDIKNLQAINEVHQKFKEAFDSLDYELFASIHSEKLIRIPGGKKIIDYDTYVNKQKSNFEKAKSENSPRTIYLRFFERVNNDSVASERGIYKFVRNENQHNEKISYGKFHVLLIKEEGDWKILMDYDSSEGKIINEEDFNKAYDMNDFEKFIKI